MRIYKMTATFGKLEQQTLELEPGLNIITAPNEWGKSTWCAFLAAMLYGLDTRAKSTKKALADKDRYAPWSGNPMAGRIDLRWKGRDITIERTTARRIPLGEFKAYETASGLPVTELTADNCGRRLLGVEQSVFRRAGFIRHGDLPVTDDEALRRRLNALVTTGDDSGGMEQLAEQLKELKNKCRYHRTGLLPQEESRRDTLEQTLGELDDLQTQSEQIRQQLEQVRSRMKLLYNHQQSLAYEKMEQDQLRVEQTRQQLENLRPQLDQLEQICAGLPDREDTQTRVRELRELVQQLQLLRMETSAAPEEPWAPEMAPPFAGMTAEQARDMVRNDAKAFVSAAGSKAPLVLIVVGMFGLMAAAALFFLRSYPFGAVAAAAAVIALVWGIWEQTAARKLVRKLTEKYGGSNWKQWLLPVNAYERELASYERMYREYRDIAEDLEVRQLVLSKRRQDYCADDAPEAVLEQWERALEAWDACLAARREYALIREQHETLRAMVQPVEKPVLADTLHYSAQETARQLALCTSEQEQLQNRLGQCQGRMAFLGERESLERTLEGCRQRVGELERTYAALTLAMETLERARAELQSRYAPRITKRAQSLMAQLTGGRYRRVTMGTDFSLCAGAEEEVTLREALWRSDGTMDQLYLALRLAVAEELTPGAPLVLDDVLVRFDDTRMAAAVELLREIARKRQVILFSCQGREETV